MVKKLPATESGPSVRCTTRAGEVYLISQNQMGDRFTLWKVLADGYEKLDTGKCPMELYDKILW